MKSQMGSFFTFMYANNLLKLVDMLEKNITVANVVYLSLINFPDVF